MGFGAIGPGQARQLRAELDHGFAGAGIGPADSETLNLRRAYLSPSGQSDAFERILLSHIAISSHRPSVACLDCTMVAAFRETLGKHA